jgi:hypothetical protein
VDFVNKRSFKHQQIEKNVIYFVDKNKSKELAPNGKTTPIWNISITLTLITERAVMVNQIG